MLKTKKDEKEKDLSNKNISIRIQGEEIQRSFDEIIKKTKI